LSATLVVPFLRLNSEKTRRNLSERCISCFPFGQKNRSELLLSLKPHVPFARNGGHHAHWFYRSLSPQGPPFVQGRVAQTCILT
jgi:hypothetical protein